MCFRAYLLIFPSLTLGFVFVCVCVCVERDREREREGRRGKGRREVGEEDCVLNGTLESENHGLLLRSNSVVCYAPLPGIF